MTRRQDPRQRLVQTALKLFASQGYHATGIADILRESGCKRGSLYHYFSSKEELGYAAIDETMRLLFEEGSASYLRGNIHPIDRLLKALDALPAVTRLGEIGSSATDVSLRMAGAHEGFRKRFEESTLAMVKQVEEMVRRGVAEGQIADSVDPHQLAHVYFTMCGGIQFTKLLLDQPVIWKNARRWLREYLNSLRK